VVVATLLAGHWLRLGSFTWAGASPMSSLLMLLLLTIPAALTALGEEFGWRGYLLPELLGRLDTPGS
jgi:membrane protease YdiL (CAAX protease family)